MKNLKYLIILLVIISCKRNHNADNNKLNSLSGTEMKYNLMQKTINDQKQRLEKGSCEFNAIQKQMFINKRLGLVSIALNANIVKHCVESLNKSDKEKIFNSFEKVYSDVVNRFNDSLDSKYPKIIGKLMEDKKDAETKEFNNCLDICGLTLLMSEGEFYVDVNNDFVYDLFKGKISAALDDYLKLRRDELKQGFSEDAEMLISFDDLYKRVTNWEDFNKKYPAFFLKTQVQQYFDTYLSTFLTGMDNTPAFDFENQILLPELKNKYEKIIAKNDSRKSTEVIAKYYEFLKTKDFKQPENIEKFMEDNGFYSMLGVQPDNR